MSSVKCRGAAAQYDQTIVVKSDFDRATDVESTQDTDINPESIERRVKLVNGTALLCIWTLLRLTATLQVAECEMY